ncbi:double-stranded rna-binding protein 4 [Quercus suber]|uniref:Double-stranded rna-binding protein 4 n=1 Tax=Quercus suber TaxID=58331 RepID=A0AAW0KZK8_QUESU
MYKTKVQELCQKKQWRPPMYSTMKDGPDHHPRFNSSVSVNGLFFHSPFPSKSSKDAQNAAAKLAFLHFTGSSATLPSTEPIDVESNTTTETYYDDDHDPQIQSDALHVTLTDDFQSQYKGLLQNYAQQKNLDPPLYMSESDGPSHTICFKATVTVGVQTFESPMFFKTLKGAEQAAAKAALIRHELAQQEGFSIPIYNTTKSGELHMPTFYSNVEVEGEIFRGKEGKSKKQAELNAAKVAYSILKERKSLVPVCDGGLSRSAEAASPSLVEDEALLTTSSTLTKTMESQQNLEDENHLLPSPIIKYKETSKEESTVDGIQEVGLMETLSSAAKFCTKDSSSSPAVLQLDQNTENGNSFSCPDSVPSSPKQGQLSSPNLAHPNFSALSNSDSNMKNVGTMSYLLCNRVRVYTSLPDIEFPRALQCFKLVTTSGWL